MKKWNLAEAEDVIRAIFLLDQSDDDQPPKLRFTDLSNRMDIHDKMLSKALRSLVSKGKLTFETKGKQKWYSLEGMNREEVIKLISSMDRMRIERASGIGATADPDENWSYYGVPLCLRSRVRPRLRSEARTFEKRLKSIWADEANRIAEDIEKKLVGRVSKMELGRGKESLLTLLFDMTEENGLRNLALFYEALIEDYLPGSKPLLKLKAEKVVDPGRVLCRNYYGLTNEQYEQSLASTKETLVEVRKVLDRLGPKDRERFTLRLLSLMDLRASLCAVVHL